MTDTVIWDFNGTLFDDLELNYRVLCKMLERRGLERITLEKYLDVFAFPLIDTYKELGFDFSSGETFSDAANEYVALYAQGADGVKTVDGATEVLRYFGETRRRQVIISAAPEELLEKQLTKLGIREFFDDVCGSDNNHGSGKTELALNWIRKSGADPKHTVFIGDTVHDYETAEKINVGCVLTATGHCSKDRLLRTGAAVADDLRSVVNLIDG